MEFTRCIDAFANLCSIMVCHNTASIHLGAINVFLYISLLTPKESFMFTIALQLFEGKYSSGSTIEIQVEHKKLFLC